MPQVRSWDHQGSGERETAFCQHSRRRAGYRPTRSECPRIASTTSATGSTTADSTATYSAAAASAAAATYSAATGGSATAANAAAATYSATTAGSATAANAAATAHTLCCISQARRKSICRSRTSRTEGLSQAQPSALKAVLQGLPPCSSRRPADNGHEGNRKLADLAGRRDNRGHVCYSP